MKYSVLICASREPTLLPRLVRILYWQGVRPELLHWDEMGSGTIRVRLVFECDPWRCQRLVMHWEKIIGVQSLVTLPMEAGQKGAPEEHYAPAAR
jgi:hypothetical protein